jgi:hypothetical protein
MDFNDFACSKESTVKSHKFLLTQHGARNMMLPVCENHTIVTASSPPLTPTWVQNLGMEFAIAEPSTRNILPQMNDRMLRNKTVVCMSCKRKKEMMLVSPKPVLLSDEVECDEIYLVAGHKGHPTVV